MTWVLVVVVVVEVEVDDEVVPSSIVSFAILTPLKVK
jgi:hypothetical protein